MVLEEAIDETPSPPGFAQDDPNTPSSDSKGPLVIPRLPASIDLRALPRTNPIARFRGKWTEEQVRAGIEFQALRRTILMGRQLRLEEWQAIAYWRAKSARYMSYGSDIGSIPAVVWAYYTHPFNGRKIVRPVTWPFYTPKNQSRFSPVKFLFLRGSPAAAAWAVSRALTYSMVWGLLSSTFMSVYATSVESVGFLRDPRSKDIAQKYKLSAPADVLAREEQVQDMLRSGQWQPSDRSYQNQGMELGSDIEPLGNDEEVTRNDFESNVQYNTRISPAQSREIDDASPTAGKEPFMYFVGDDEQEKEQKHDQSYTEAPQQPVRGSAWNRLRQGRQPRSQPPLQQKWRPSPDAQDTQQRAQPTQGSDQDAWQAQRQMQNNREETQSRPTGDRSDFTTTGSSGKSTYRETADGSSSDSWRGS